MKPAVMISVEEYLATGFRPDAEYLEGSILERNLGEYDHSRCQGRVFALLFSQEARWRIRVLPEQRVQVRSNRFRVPDICAVRAESPIEQIITTPPFLCIEILSRDDTMSQMQERIDDYLAMGVPYVWVLDPRRRTAMAYSGVAMREAGPDGVLRTVRPDIEVPLKEIFES
ncbi:MAG: Uma2 family endonuclease [Bryobacteraceae bacterium]